MRVKSSSVSLFLASSAILAVTATETANVTAPPDDPPLHSSATVINRGPSHRLPEPWPLLITVAQEKYTDRLRDPFPDQYREAVYDGGTKKQLVTIKLTPKPVALHPIPGTKDQYYAAGVDIIGDDAPEWPVRIDVALHGHTPVKESIDILQSWGSEADENKTNLIDFGNGVSCIIPQLDFDTACNSHHLDSNDQVLQDKIWETSGAERLLKCFLLANEETDWVRKLDQWAMTDGLSSMSMVRLLSGSVANALPSRPRL
jgi:hypothetical protein